MDVLFIHFIFTSTLRDAFVDISFPPTNHGSSVIDTHDDVNGDIYSCIRNNEDGPLILNNTRLPRSWLPREYFFQRIKLHDMTENRTWDFMITSQWTQPLIHCFDVF